MALNLPASIYTPQLLGMVRDEVAALQSWLQDTAVRHKVGAEPDPRPELSPEAQALITDRLDGAAETPAHLAALAKELSALTPVTVHVTLAAPAPERIRRQLVQWLRTNGRPDVLVAFTADRTIGGGIIIRTPNRLFNLSFKEQLMAGRSRLPQLVRHV